MAEGGRKCSSASAAAESTTAEVAGARSRTGDAGRAGANPVYLVEGHVLDCYSPRQGRSVRNVWTEVGKKVDDRETQRVVLNLRDRGGDLSALGEQFDDWRVVGLKELAVVTSAGEIVPLVPRPSTVRGSATMGVAYRLTLAGDIPAEQVAECAVPDPADRPRWQEGRLLGVGLYDTHGFYLSVRAGRDGYRDAGDDGGSSWEWELDAYVDVSFLMDKKGRWEESIANMLTIVARVLEGRSEDAALVFNGGPLLLTRVGGVLRKHNRVTWWDHYGFLNDILPG